MGEIIIKKYADLKDINRREGIDIGPYGDPDWVEGVRKEDEDCRRALLKAAKDRCKIIVSFSFMSQEEWDRIFKKEDNGVSNKD